MATSAIVDYTLFVIDCDLEASEEFNGVLVFSVLEEASEKALQ